MNDHAVRISFPDAMKSEGNNLALGLKDFLLQRLGSDAATTVKIVRQDEESQDFGATLVLVLGSPFLVLLGHAIRDFAVRENQGRIRIGNTIVDGLRSEDIPAAIAELAQHDNEE